MLLVMGDFQRLSVWQQAHVLALEVHRSTGAFPAIERYGLAAQMRRAAVSVVSNIAEGCGRQSDRELAYFLRMARGSVRELQCQLLLSRDLGYITNGGMEEAGCEYSEHEQDAQRYDSDCTAEGSKLLAPSS
jgi:four helix bundle protein